MLNRYIYNDKSNKLDGILLNLEIIIYIAIYRLCVDKREVERKREI